MATIPQTNVSISAINTEVDTVSSNSLKTLSDAAKSGSDPKDGAPYGMGEFRGYDHGPSTQTITYTSTGPIGKIDNYSSSNHSTTTMAFGGANLSQFINMGSGWFRIQWSGGLNTNWTSLTISGQTLLRTNATSTSNNTHGFLSSSFYDVGNGTAVFTYP
tara:strand:+ start:12632 stop:13111 length:480 start_codon:yes stop_codon:yes gene_type:complete